MNCMHVQHISIYYIHKRRICGMLLSDWFATSRMLAHICLVRKVNKMAATFWAFR